MADTATPVRLQFGPFLADFRACELRKDGRRIRLQEKPMLLLGALASKPGEVISREDLQKLLWPGDTFVDFEIGLNAVVRKLREALADSPENPKYIETIPKRGYRFLAAVAPDGRGEQALSLKQTPADGSPTDTGLGRRTIASLVETVSEYRRAKRFWMSIAVALALSGLALMLLRNVAKVAEQMFGAGRAPAVHSIAVLPLQSLSTDPAQEYFSDGMTDALITDLAQIESIKVISRTSSMHYKRTDKSLPEITRELNVDGVVEGTVQRSGDRVRVTVQFVHGASDKHIWARSYDRELRDALKLQEEISRDVAEGISVTLAQSPGRGAARSHPINIEAYDDYLKGRTHTRRVTEDDVIQGVTLLERSIERDPGFAPAYAELALANNALATYNHRPPREVMPKAKAAAMKAIALDENLADGHSALGLILGVSEWDWTGQEKELKRAIQLEPNSSLAHVAYALHLTTMGRRSESVQELNIALDLDPYSPLVLATASFILLGAHEYEAAVREARRALEIAPNYVEGHLCLASALGIAGKDDEAFSEWLRFLSLDGEEELAQELESAAKNLSSQDDPGRKLAPITLRYYQRKAKTQYVAAITMALAYIDLGDRDKMFEWLDKAYEEHSTVLYAIASYPNFEPLHSDPRFRDLIRRMNLPQ